MAELNQGKIRCIQDPCVDVTSMLQFARRRRQDEGRNEGDGRHKGDGREYGMKGDDDEG